MPDKNVFMLDLRKGPLKGCFGLIKAKTSEPLNGVYFWSHKDVYETKVSYFDEI